MPSKHDTDELLHRLLMLTGFSYISDLHQLNDKQTLSAALSRISPEDYTTEAWDAAARYIMGRAYNKTASESPYAFIVSWAKHRHCSYNL